MQTQRPLRQIQTSENEIQSTTQRFQQQFITVKLFNCFNLKCYFLLKNFTLYQYFSKQAFLSDPLVPIKFFNLTNLKIQSLSQNWLKLTDLHFEEEITHENLQKLQEFRKVIENNKRNVNMRVLFPKRFQELDQRMYEKIQQQKV